MEMQVEIRFKKCGISNQPDVCIFDDPCLSKFGALRGSCPHPGRQFVGLLCVSLAAPESPPIVSGVSDMHPSDCPNVEETRNPMQTFSRKKCSHFSPTNFHLHFHMKSPSVFPVILLIKPKHGMLRATPPFIFISIQCFSAMRYTPSPSNAGMKLSFAVSPS